MSILCLFLINLLFMKIQSNSNSFCGSYLLKKNITKKKLKNNSIINSYQNKTNDSKRKLSTDYTPLNIIIDNKYLSYQLQNHIISDKKYDLILNSLEKAASIMSLLLSVEKDEDRTIALDDGAIAEIKTKCYLDEHSFTERDEIPSDSVIIYPRFHDFNQGDKRNIKSSAKFCYLDDDVHNFRPLAGFIYVEQNITEIEMRKKNIDKYYTMIFLHELTHILVFDEELFEKNNNIYIQEIEILGQIRNIISTPKVLEMARRHFGCNELKGIELENQEYEWKNNEEDNYGAFVDISKNHWDARIMLTDYMTAVEYDEMVISEITLALFEDSGWYKVNYYTGGLFRYGKNQGCEFINGYCVYGDVSKHKNEYCITEQTTMCTPGRTHRGMCGLTTYPTELDRKYRYFTDSKKGGHLSQVDYCPVAKTNSSVSRTYFLQGHCNYGEAEMYPGNLGYSMSVNSICLLSSLTPKNDENLKEYPSSFRALCYKVDCYNKNGEKAVRIYIGNNVIFCPVSGGTQTLDGYNGYILCPDYNLICTGSIWCLDAISCAEKKSEALSESFEYDYQSSTSQEYTGLLDYKVSTGNKVISYGSYLPIMNIFKYIFIFLL